MDLHYHQQVAQAVQIEAKLNTVRGATPKTENQWKLSSETPRDQPGNNGNRFHQNGSLPPIRRENGANTQFVRDRMTQGANKQPTNRFTGANNHNVHNRALNITRNEPKKPYRNGQKGYTPTLVLTVNGQQYRGLVDTGANLSVLSQGTWSRLATDSDKLTSSEETCIGANGLPIKVIGDCVIPVKYNSIHLEGVLFSVAPDSLGHDMIIGTDLMDMLGLELYDRNTKQRMSLPSLSYPTQTSGKMNVKSPIHVLQTTVVKPNGSAKLVVEFNGNSDKLYVMEPYNFECSIPYPFGVGEEQPGKRVDVDCPKRF
ncbi:hypothetical protein L596_029620 [Steinernema carpocapsae]|uniref:Peptidase A2 domain-containing protein n=1 Tax=Steinernema carpocapsae TaxID=34508 RepID=A0A4U5LV65_STECR|nr:hypothetical protein L596_029620 [Steinernema carpocapsae]